MKLIELFESPISNTTDNEYHLKNPAQDQCVKDFINEAVYRIDHGNFNTSPKDFSKNLNIYQHNSDWTQSGKVDKKIPSLYKTKIAKGLFSGTKKDTAPYVIPRDVSWTQHIDPNTNQSIVAIDKKSKQKVYNARPVLSSWSKKNKFNILQSGEYFSEDPGRPTSRKLITNPIKHMSDNGHVVKFVNMKDHIDDLKNRGIEFNYEGDPKDLY